MRMWFKPLYFPIISSVYNTCIHNVYNDDVDDGDDNDDDDDDECDKGWKEVETPFFNPNDETRSRTPHYTYFSYFTHIPIPNICIYISLEMCVYILCNTNRFLSVSTHTHKKRVKTSMHQNNLSIIYIYTSVWLTNIIFWKMCLHLLCECWIRRIRFANCFRQLFFVARGFQRWWDHFVVHVCMHSSIYNNVWIKSASSFA